MHELLTTAQMAEADRLTIAGGVPGIDLMERAGRAVADHVTSLSAESRRVLVVAGPGNNGGDGFVAARLLAERGFDVEVALLGKVSALKGDAAEAARRWTGVTADATPERVRGVHIIVDAIFGAGLDRPVDGVARSLIEAINASSRPVIAVDLPSGINGNSGAIMGVAVHATATVTFFRRKPGYLLLPGRLHCGAIHVADIGIGESVLETIRPATFANEPALWARDYPQPRVDGHKYNRGHAVVVSGPMAATGAARLAARAALRIGAGLVTLASPRDALAVNAANSLAVMVKQVGNARELTAMLRDKRHNAVVLGPGNGVGAGTRSKVLAALASEVGVVLDADALTSFAATPETLFKALAKRKTRATVLTPHLGEFSRLFNKIKPSAHVHSKLEQGRAAASQANAVILLKGPDTVVAHPDGRAAIAANAPPWLATAGAGDVLAGMIGGLLAQDMPAFEAANAAVWLHGEAANAFGPGLIAEDLPETLPQVLRPFIRPFSR